MLEAAERCAQWLREAERPTLALSGGTTPRVMLERLSELEVDWARVHVFQVDERCVAEEDEQSNYRMIRRALLDRAGVPEANRHRMRGELEPDRAAADYEAELLRFFAGRAVRFDVMVCGVGEDGHTASLFPGDPMVLDGTGLVAARWVEAKRQHRITLLPAAILAARHLLVLAGGEAKREAVRRARYGSYDVLATPAQLLRSGEWIVDGEADGYTGHHAD